MQLGLHADRRSIGIGDIMFSFREPIDPAYLWYRLGDRVSWTFQLHRA